MSINTDLLNKGLKQLLFLILLLIVSPISLNIAFKALNKFENDSIWIAYLILGASALLVIITLILALKTFKTFLNALFNS
jgi:hypothetical protein